MNLTRKVEVLKRDGSTEAFDVAKLAGMLRKGMHHLGFSARNAGDLAGAVEIYLHRMQQQVVSSSAVFEMGLKTLHHVGMDDVSEIIELTRNLRTVRRSMLRVRQDDGRLVAWDKGWLANLGGRMWCLSPNCARILAGEVEQQLLAVDAVEISRFEILEMFNRHVFEFGLADAVPV
jgi:transcriptional regulator NrdR family protein